jgi:hypothetical protein
MVDSGVSVDVTDSYTVSYVIPTQADILIAFSTMEGTDNNTINRNGNCLLSCNWSRRIAIPIREVAHTAREASFETKSRRPPVASRACVLQLIPGLFQHSPRVLHRPYVLDQLVGSHGGDALNPRLGLV